MGAVKNHFHDEISGIYRSFYIEHWLKPMPDRRHDYQAFDPDSEGGPIASGATLAECRADVDRYIEEQSE